jgi:hypothetical protein
MWSFIVSNPKVMGILILPSLALARMSPSWSVSYVNEPYYIGGTFHPTLQGSGKLDLGSVFRLQTRLSLSLEAYGLFEPRRDPRALEIAWGVLGGTHLPFVLGWMEASAGAGAVLGRTQGALHYRHDWGGGVFATTTLEYRERIYADVGIPFQVQWLFGRDQEGFGLEYSGFVSRELRRWGVGVFWQYYLGAAPRPKPKRGPRHFETPPSPEPGWEELEE